MTETTKLDARSPHARLKAYLPESEDRLHLEAELLKLESRLFVADRLIGNGDDESANGAETVVGDALQAVRALRQRLFPKAAPQGGEQA
jgi:hypothetical protein